LKHPQKPRSQAVTIETDIARLVRKEYPSRPIGITPGLSRAQKWAIAITAIILTLGAVASRPDRPAPARADVSYKPLEQIQYVAREGAGIARGCEIMSEIIRQGWTGRMSRPDEQPKACRDFVAEMTRDAKGATKDERRESMFLNCAMQVKASADPLAMVAEQTRITW
jgi:hypothetical protein